MCPKSFTPQRMGQVVCSRWCALRKARHDRVAEEKAEKQSFKARKEAIKTIPELIREADKAFAAYIRERDRLAGYPCISSGRPLDWSGNATDAGHFRSRGAASHLRYNEDNCHAQSKHDNRYLSGNVAAYRIGLIARIGITAVEALENNNIPHKWSREELTSIRDEYKKKLKELKQ